MNERKEPTIHGMGSDLGSAHTEKKHTPVPPAAESMHAEPRKPTEPAAAVKPQTPRRPATPATPAATVTRAAVVQPAGNSRLTIIALALGALGLLSSLLIYSQLAQQLQTAQHDLTEADKRIVELESRLALADNASDQSVTAIHEKLKWADAEIRKLWAIANDRNRKAIESNTAQIAVLSASVKAASSGIDGLKADASTGKKLATDNAVQIRQMSLQISAAAEQASQAFDDASGSRKELRTMGSKVAAMDKTVQSVDGRMSTTEEAIRAIDAHRIKLNRDVQNLQDRFTNIGK